MKGHTAEVAVAVTEASGDAGLDDWGARSKVGWVMLPVTGRTSVPARVIGRFSPIAATEWRRLDNNSKAEFGKRRFLELPDTLDANKERVRDWLTSHGLALGRSEWVEVPILPGVPPRYANVTYSSRAVDAFVTDSSGRLEGCELKVSGDDGVCGLTLASQRLLAAGLLRLFAVNPVLGLVGEMDAKVLLGVPRRLDGVPVGEARVEWIDDRRREAAGPSVTTSTRSRHPAGSTPPTALAERPPASDRESDLWRRLLDGFDYTSRPNLRVHRIYGASQVTVGEVCVGTTGRTRLNFKESVVGQPTTINVTLEGRSHTWRGGGVVVTADTLDDCRQLISHVVDAARLAR
jgi:hypothetical protein